MVWQEVAALLRENIAVNSLGVPDLKSISECIARVGANNLMVPTKMQKKSRQQAYELFIHIHIERVLCFTFKKSWDA